MFVKSTVGETNNGQRKKSKKQKVVRRRARVLLPFKRPCQHNTKSFKCSEISGDDVRCAREKFFALSKIEQDNRLLLNISVKSSLIGKKKTISVEYYIKNAVEQVRVCKNFISQALRVSHTRLTRIAKEIEKGLVPKEKRGGDRKSAKSADIRVNIFDFISSLPASESHYNRAKSKRIYLDSQWSVRRLTNAFNSSHSVKCSESMFYKVFTEKFNIGFKSPSSDRCTFCVRHEEMISSETDEYKLSQMTAELTAHKMKAKAFFDLMKNIGPDAYGFCFDLEQVKPLPKTPIQEAYYARQLGLYCFGCVQLDTRNPHFYMWTENQAGRGATEVSSALMNYLNSLDLSNKKSVFMFCDGCPGQNKNNFVIHALMYWLFNAKNNVKEIEIIFPVRGHSFLPADRVFGRVEKILRKHEVICNEKKYYDLYKEVGEVKVLGTDWELYDVKSLTKHTYKKIECISDMKKIKIFKENGIVKLKKYRHYNFDENNAPLTTLLKKGSNPRRQLNRVPLGRPVPQEKINDIFGLLEKHFGSEWKTRPDLQLFTSLVEGQEEINNNNCEEYCDCLEEDPGIIL